MFLQIIKKRFLANKTYTLVIAASFLICFCCIHTFLVVHSNLKQGFTNHAHLNDIIVGTYNSPTNYIKNGLLLSNSNTTTLPIKKLSSNIIQYQAPIYLGESYKKFNIVGTNSSFFKIIEKTTPIKNIKLNKHDVILGYNVAKKLNYKKNDIIHIDHHSHDHSHNEFKIHKSLPKLNNMIDNKIFISEKSFLEMHNKHNNIYPHYIWATLSKPMLFFNLKQKLEPTYKVFSAKLSKKEFINSFTTLFFILKLIILCLITISCLQIVFYASNKFSVLKKEILILKDYGASEKFITFSIFVEFIIIFIISLSLAITLSYFHLNAFNPIYENLIIFPINNYFLSLKIYFLSILIPVSLMLLISYIFSKTIYNSETN